MSIIKFEVPKAFDSGYLKVSEIHSIAWDVRGNPTGLPVVILHGGPGSGRRPHLYCGFFDPKIHMIVQFDQRGCGESTPFACLEENTTWELVEDIEKLREHLKIEKWHIVFGCSWGSTLSLAYSQTHPNRLLNQLIHGVFLTRKSELNYFIQNGTNWFYPEYHEALRSLLPEVQQDDILSNYYRILTSPNTSEEEKMKYASAWNAWETATSKLFVDDEAVKKGREGKATIAVAIMETHYFVHGGFFRNSDHLLDDCSKIQHIPTVIVQGRYDMVCPAKSAFDVKKRLPLAELFIIPDAGHSSQEPNTVQQILKSVQKFFEQTTSSL